MGIRRLSLFANLLISDTTGSTSKCRKTFDVMHRFFLGGSIRCLGGQLLLVLMISAKSGICSLVWRGCMIS